LEKEQSLSIAQSGNNISLDLGDGLAGSGVIEGATLKAFITIPGTWLGGAAGCERDGGLLLKAIMKPDVKPRIILGTIIKNDCASCTPLEFRAVKRVPADATKGQ
jgi:hypothetical protein